MYVSPERDIARIHQAAESSSAMYVGLPVGDGQCRLNYLLEKAGEIESAVGSIMSVKDSEVQFRLRCHGRSGPGPLPRGGAFRDSRLG